MKICTGNKYSDTAHRLAGVTHFVTSARVLQCRSGHWKRLTLRLAVGPS